MTLVSFVRPQGRTLKLVVTGTGRSGTGFASRWLTSIGIPSGHESFFDHRGLDHAVHMLAARDYHFVGECSWEAAPHLGSQPLRDALVVHQVRHPRKVIESCLRVPQEITPHYARYMEKHLPRIKLYRMTLDRSACRWVYWNRMIEDAIRDREHYFWRVEDGTEGLLDWLEDHGLVDRTKIVAAQVFSNTHHNHKHGPEKRAVLEEIDGRLQWELQGQMRRYGYNRW